MWLATEDSSDQRIRMHAKRLPASTDYLWLRLAVELRARREIGIPRPPAARKLGCVSGELEQSTDCHERRRIRLQREWRQCPDQGRRGPAAGPAARRIRSVAERHLRRCEVHPDQCPDRIPRWHSDPRYAAGVGLRDSGMEPLPERQPVAVRLARG